MKNKLLSPRWISAETVFSLKTAFFYTFMICLVVGVDMYNGAIFRAKLPSGFPQCPLGYKVLLVAIPLFVGNFILIVIIKNWYARCIVPFIFTVLLGWAISAYDFPPFPNYYQMLALALFPVPGLFACGIRFTPSEEEQACKTEIPLSARIEWIKEMTTYWKTICFSGLLAYFTFIYFWLTYMWSIPPKFLDDAHSQLAVQAMISIQATCISINVVCGPSYECFRRAKNLTGLLLKCQENKSGHK